MNKNHTIIKELIKVHSLDKSLNHKLLDHLELFSFKKNQEIYSQNEIQNFLYFLVNGRLQVNMYHRNGKVSVLAFLEPVSMIGDLEIFDFEVVKYNVTTITESLCLGIRKEIVFKYGQQDPKFLKLVISNLGQKLFLVSKILINILQPLKNRFAYYILQCDKNQNEELILDKREYTASLLGTTKRHLNRVIEQLKKDNVIHMKRNRLIILDYDQLKQLADGE